MAELNRPARRYFWAGAWAISFASLLHGGFLRPDFLPVASGVCLFLGSWPIYLAWRALAGSPLRMASLWAGFATILALLGQITATGEPLIGGRLGTGIFAYLATLAILCGLMTVLGARRPGTGAWTLLMLMLFLVLLLPLFESSVLTSRRRGPDSLRLEAPWSLFIVVLSIAGVTNYLPTRWSLSASLLGVGLALELSGLLLSWTPGRQAIVWSLVPGIYGLAASSAMFAIRETKSADPLSRLWRWFRDRWGVVWSLRVAEKFNETAVKSGWATRLSWQGASPAESETGPPESSSREALATLHILLRRFATREELELLTSRSPEEA